MHLYLCEKGKFLYILYLVRKSVISCVLCASVKVTGLWWAEKIPSEYWNNRILLMSLKTRFCSWFFQVAKKLINQFLLFQYSCLYISAKKRNSWTFYISLERAWLAVYCVQVWKLQVFHALPGYQKLINQFLLFQHSCLYIFAKNRYF